MKMSMVVGIVVTLVLGMGMYSWQMQQLTKSTGAGSASQIVDAVAVKADLMGMAGAERQQLALEGRYASYEELQKKGAALPEKRGPYVYSIELSPKTFLVRAKYVTPQGGTPQPDLTIGPDGKIKKDGQPDSENE
jgi:hypothetical protein